MHASFDHLKPRDNDAGDGATADRIMAELCPVDRTNPTWRYLVRKAALEGIRAERRRVLREAHQAKMAGAGRVLEARDAE